MPLNAPDSVDCSGIELTWDIPIIERSASSEVREFRFDAEGISVPPVPPAPAVCLFLALRSRMCSRSMYMAQKTSDFREDVDVDTPVFSATRWFEVERLNIVPILHNLPAIIEEMD